MLNNSALAAVVKIAGAHKLDPAALASVVDVESAGKVFARVNGRDEPLIRFEGHYFDRRVSGVLRDRARKEGLASPRAGGVPNPGSQTARWALLERAAKIDRQAAYESCSWGCGQVMGAHWKWLGFPTVIALVELCRSGIEGQIELMVRFIKKAGLAGALNARNWTGFAKGYNGPAYAVNKYHTKMASAYKRYKVKIGQGGIVAATGTSDAAFAIQRRLAVHGFYADKPNGLRDRRMDEAVRAFQKARGLVVDGIVGSSTWTALEGEPLASLPREIRAPAESDPVSDNPATVDVGDAGEDTRIPTETGAGEAEASAPVVREGETPKRGLAGLISTLVKLAKAIFGRKA